jgi:hypothetical protein
LNKYQELSAVLFIALLAFTMTFLTQGFTYFYHMVPALSLAILMMMQLFTNIIAQPALTSKDYKLMAMPAMCLLLMQAYQVNLSFSMIFLDPAVFFVVFVMGFSTLFLVFGFTKNVIVASASSIMMAMAAYLLSVMFADNKGAYFLQIILMLSIFAVFCKVALAKTTTHFLQTLFMTLLSVSLLLIPSWVDLHVYEVGLQYKRFTLNKLIEFMRTQPPRSSIYMLATGIHFTFPMASYTDAIISQRFDALWMVRGLIKDVIKQDGHEVKEQIRSNANKMFVVNMVVDDLRRQKPQLVFVETKYAGQRTFNFNFLEYFLENNAFQQVWQNYHYYTTVQQPGTFRLDVYKRNDSSSMSLTSTPSQAL